MLEKNGKAGETISTPLGNRIKNIRTSLGLTMEEFIERIDNKSGKGKSGTVNNWESGKNAPNKKRLKQIANLGGVSVEYLLNGSISERLLQRLSFCRTIWAIFKKNGSFDNLQSSPDLADLSSNDLNALVEIVKMIDDDNYFAGGAGTKDNFEAGLSFVQQQTSKLLSSFPNEEPLTFAKKDGIIVLMKEVAQTHYEATHTSNAIIKQAVISSLENLLNEVNARAHGTDPSESYSHKELVPLVTSSFMKQVNDVLNKCINELKLL